MTMTEIAAPGAALAGLLDAGARVTYTPDTVGGGWYADLRDALGRVIESGGGITQGEALARLEERLARPETAERAAVMMAAPGCRDVAGQLYALLDEGYRVEFSKDPEGYAVGFTGGRFCGRTSAQDSVDNALYAAVAYTGN